MLRTNIQHVSYGQIGLIRLSQIIPDLHYRGRYTSPDLW